MGLWSLIGILLLVFLVEGNTNDTWVVQLEPNVNALGYAIEHNLHLVGPSHIDPDMYVFSLPAPRKHAERHQIQERLEGHPNCQWARRQVARQQFRRFTQEDPLYESQWHLHREGMGTSSPACVDAIDLNVTGNGVTIAFVDDGLDHTHPEFQGKYDARHSYNFNGGPSGDGDPAPVSGHNGHGTSAAGVAVANQHNGHCGRGVAPGAKVSAMRLIAAPSTDLQEGQALTKYFSNNDIYSNSWGPVDSGRGMDAPGLVVRAAFARFAGQGLGRQGKGTIYVWASGNGHENGDTCAYDGYASNPYVIPIGAVSFLGVRSYYSEGCSALMAVAPSSGAGRGIITSDIQGPGGYSAGECNLSFGGTSSAAPLAAGIIALMLEKRPDLTWRDVKHVIALGARKIDADDLSWHDNPRTGYHHSNTYGFGLLHVPSLLKALDHYDPVPKHQKQVFSGIVKRSNLAVGSDASGGTRIKFDFSDTQLTFIEHVVAMVELRHPRRGNVQVSITSPEGTTSILGDYRDNDYNADYPRDGWHFSSAHFWGEQTVDGNWTLTFKDNGGEGRGSILSAQMGVFGF